jgi:8-oxo-dGTP pyrophosphatase MutT (NUDIX family)
MRPSTGQAQTEHKTRIMNASRHREIACAIVIDTLGRFLLQQRDNIPGIVQPGKVGLFGGHREDGETYLQCVVREIYEEISHFVPPERFEHLATYEGTEFEADGGTVRGEFFVVRDVPADAVIVTEGSLLIVEPDKLSRVEHKLTPSTQFALKAFFDRSPGFTD